MKISKVLALLCVVGVTSALMSMEKEQVGQQGKGYLIFTLNNDKSIVACAKHNMDYKIKSKVFFGKKITDLGLLNEHDKNAVEHGFNLAIESKNTVKVPYKLDDKKFVAKIIAQKTEDTKRMFFVKVQEIK